MTIKVGDKIPSVTLRYLTPEGPKARQLGRVFCRQEGCAVRGARSLYANLLAAASAELCHECGGSSRPRASTRSLAWRSTIAFVMGAWGKEHKAGDIVMLGDGSGDFTRAIGLELDRIKEGMGIRSQRYSMLVDNGVVKALHVEAPGQYEVSSAEAMLKVL